MNRKKKKPLSGRMTTAWLVLMSVFVFEMFFYAWCRVQCIHEGYDITVANNRNRELATLQSNLRIELEHLKSPERISRIAREKIGLVKPTPGQMVIIQ